MPRKIPISLVPHTMEIIMFLGILISAAIMLAIAAAVTKSVPCAIGAIALGVLVAFSIYRNLKRPLSLEE
jgi:hypothetical protein